MAALSRKLQRIPGASMINKNNWKLINTFLEYRKQVDQLSEGSYKGEEISMRYLLEWAGSTAFRNAPSIRPTFPEFLLSQRLEGSDKPFSAGYIKKKIAAARRFFLWLTENNVGYSAIKRNWISTLKVRRISDIPRTKEAVSLEEILQIAAAPAKNTKEKRIRAAAVMLFLSGMRIGAFVTLPLLAVDIDNRKVDQFPSLGVRTKNSKHGTTFLFDIPELLTVVKEWDNEVRKILSDTGYWFAPLSPETGEIDTQKTEIGEYRFSNARRDLREWLDKVNLPYHSPHKFRHGHIHFGLSHAENLADFKAISQNAMHSSMEITDQFYSNQNDKEIQDRISQLGKNGKNREINQKDFALFMEFLSWKEKLGL